LSVLLWAIRLKCQNFPPDVLGVKINAVLLNIKRRRFGEKVSGMNQTRMVKKILEASEKK
jgi:hypothetical protein